MPSVLVTGHRGLLGSTLVRVLREAGSVVHTFDGDLTDERVFRAFVDRMDALDIIVHTAAATDVKRCEQEQEWCTRINVDGTRIVRDAAVSRQAKLIFISTVSVFSGEVGNYSEGDEPDPRNHYNTTKFLGEKIVLEYEHGLVLRLNLIGIHPDGSRGKNFMEWLVDSVRGNKDMKLFTDIRINPLSNVTLAEQIRDLILQWPTNRILHLGSRTVLSKADIGRMVLARFPEYRGIAEFVSIDDVPSKAFRSKEMWLNVERVQQQLGMRMPTVEEEVSRILKTIS